MNQQTGPVVFWVSMAHRRNRRWLVLATYAFLGLASTAFIALQPWQHSSWIIWLQVWVQLILSGVMRGVFGDVVKQSLFREPDPRRVQGVLGLTTWSRTLVQQPVECDERESAVRDRAYFVAYRGLAVLVLAVCLMFAIVLPSASTQTARVMSIAVLLVATAVTITLPQAAILWTEPDMPGENGGIQGG